MKKFRTLFPFVLLLFVFSAARLHAQDDGGGLGGCENSPENPTLILGAIASAGGIGFVRLRRYLANRNNSDKK